MNRPITEDVTPITDSFSRWAKRVQADASASPKALYAEGATAEQPYYFSKPCLGACCGLLMAVDTYHQVIPCRKELLRNKDFKALGEGSAADWEGISKWLVRRAGTHAQHPTYHRAGDPPQVITCNIGERLRLACCSSEVAVLMLRLAVRTACLAGSLYGPWESREALLQLIGANAWSSLLGALDALLGTFGADLDKQYNALNIVSDILHVSPAPSQWSSLTLQLHIAEQCRRFAGLDANVVDASADLLQPERVAHPCGLHALRLWRTAQRHPETDDVPDAGAHTSPATHAAATGQHG